MDTVLIITLWIASGALIGGVVTPLLAERKRFNDGLSAVIGTIAGGVGGLLLLGPLWLFIANQPNSADTRPMWQRDALSLQDTITAGPESAREQAAALLDVLRDNFWPTARTDGHSHRMTYVGVFVALALITFVEVSLIYVDVPFSVVAPLVALSTAKVLLVAAFFMHLRYDSIWYTAVMVSTLPFAALMVVILALS